MAVGFTYSAASEILKGKIKSTTYIGMSSTTPNKSGGNFTEPAASTGYTRRMIGEIDSSIAAQVANKDIIFIFEALEDCGSFTHIGLSDTKEGAVFLVAQLAPPVTVPAGYVPLIRAHKLVIGLDKESLEAYV